MKSIDIKGKMYVPVNERVKEFRSNAIYKNYKIENDFVEINDKFCIVKSKIYNDKNEVVATGFAREVNGDSYINKTSYVENCETSAIGRALGLLGVGIDEAFASADEVLNAVENQNKQTTKAPAPASTEKKTKILKLETEYKGKLQYATWGELIHLEPNYLKELEGMKESCKKYNIEVKYHPEFQKALDGLQIGM
jgi:hypothetical protein